MIASAPSSPAEQAVVRKVALRLVPFLVLLYFIAFLDRVNVGFASLHMNEDIGLSKAAYGFGAGIFFIGYFFFEVPSNLLLKRFGARVWIARIMLTWGVVSIAMAFVTGPTSFYVLRFLLGVAEAGFFPGIILYLTFWFPNSVRGGIVGYFLLANPLATIIGAPLSTALMGAPLAGFNGWQTMFIIEGLPAIVLGVIVLYYLRDTPAQAEWLSDAERHTLESALERDRQGSSHFSLRAGLLRPEVWALSLVAFGLIFGVYGFGFWVPLMVKSLGSFSDREIGALVAIPYICGAVAMFLWGRHSDRSGERAWHLAVPALIGAVGFLVGSHVTDIYVSIVAFSFGAIGIYAALPVFWTIPTALLSGTAAAGGIALINSIANLSGYAGPHILGILKETTGGYSAGLVTLAGSLVFAGALGLHMGRRHGRRGTMAVTS